MTSFQLTLAILMSAAALIMFLVWRSDRKPILGFAAAIFAFSALLFLAVAYTAP